MRARNAFLVLVSLLLVVLCGCPEVRAKSGDYYIEVNDVTRKFRLFVPSSYDGLEPAPLVIALHGLFDDGAGAARMTGFERVAEEHGFVVAFPDGLLRSWLALPPDYQLPLLQEALQPLLDTIDDVGFIEKLMDVLSATLNLDAERVYVSGASAGGMMSFLVALELPDRVAAAAAVMATLPEPFAEKGAPELAVPMIIMHGTEDPIIPHEGGNVFGVDVSLDWNIGMEDPLDFDFLSAEDTARFWVERNGAEPTPWVRRLPDHDPRDNATATRAVYPGEAEVVLYTIEGGGHTWPGGPQYLPKLLIGNTCRDFDATEAIWEFFSRFRREHEI